MTQPGTKPMMIDATAQPLGRLASRVAFLLLGKHQPAYAPSIPSTQLVHVKNIARVHIAPRTLDQRLYYRASGYPGGLKAKPMRAAFSADPAAVFVRTVKGMLPATKNRRILLNHLTVE